MAVYRQIQTTFWQDSFVLSLTPEEKYFYIYLMTNSKTKQCGIYELPLQIAQVETGYNRETVIKLIQKFIEHGKIMYDWETNEIALKNWIKYNPFNGNPKIEVCVSKELQCVKNRSLVDFMKYGEFESKYPFGRVSQEKEKEEQKEEEEQKQSTELLFEQLWALYPRKEGKKESFRHFKATVKTNDDYVNILKAITNYNTALKNKKTEPQFIQQGSRWFNNWQDWISPDEIMMKGSNGNTQQPVRKSDASTRATFRHTPEQIKELESFGESLRQRDRERSERT